MENRQKRLSLRTKTNLIWSGQRTTGTVENLSLGGALLTGKAVIAVGDNISFKLEDPALQISLEMWGSVVRIDDNPQGRSTFALKFYAVPEALRVLLHQLMAKEAMVAEMEHVL